MRFFRLTEFTDFRLYNYDANGSTINFTFALLSETSEETKHMILNITVSGMYDHFIIDLETDI
ncbi:hypothetical protein EZV73_18130 [Acidaminobacter sp. JC074]|uniref:hypothetical protein n=1 Tax=Acidaminobacter sp. JC074 TaxID=2530199 RepID=UPI001F0CDF9F|nr:hypothetical protein [Acidaminobacter sp. JC074]MCH4889505.1 hypothetical protein [Acidaminobacter sp. JC074]